jgi:zinc transporter
MTEITNRRLFTLSVLTACMLPATLVTGFFGMNTKDMPFQTGDGGTWYALLLVIAAGALTWWLLRHLPCAGTNDNIVRPEVTCAHM